MAVDWRIQGVDLTTCTCDGGCSCRRAAVGFRIDKGHYGRLSLDGLAFGGLFAWPKAIHEGNGEAQPIVDVRANDAQRDAILKILSGEDTEPGATIFNVFAATYAKVHSPIFRPIILEVDLAKRTARFEVEGVVEARIEPIRNPITGAPSYAQTPLRAGFEYEQAEVGSSHVRTKPGATVSLEWEGQHGHIAKLDMTGKGLVRTRAA